MDWQGLQWECKRNPRWRQTSIAHLLLSPPSDDQLEKVLQIAEAGDVSASATLKALQLLADSSSISGTGISGGGISGGSGVGGSNQGVDAVGSSSSSSRMRRKRMRRIVKSVLVCRFEASSSGGGGDYDECVLSQILTVLHRHVDSQHTGHELVCRAMETCCSMLFQPRLSLLLRQQARTVLLSVCAQLLPLHSVKATGGDDDDDDNEKAYQQQQKNVAEEQLYVHVVPLVQPSRAEKDKENRTMNISREQLAMSPSQDGLPKYSHEVEQEINGDDEENVEQCSGKTLREIVAFLVKAVNPSDLHNTETTRTVAMDVLATFIIGGVNELAKNAHVMQVLGTDLARSVYLSIRSSLMAVNIPLLCTCMRAVYAMSLLLSEDVRMYKHVEFTVGLLLSYLDETLPAARLLPMDANEIKDVQQGVKLVLQKYNCEWAPDTAVKLLCERAPTTAATAFNYKPYGPQTTDPRSVVLDTLQLMCASADFTQKMFTRSDCNLASSVDVYGRMVAVLTRLVAVPLLVQEVQITQLTNNMMAAVTAADREKYERLGDVVVVQGVYGEISASAMEFLIAVNEQSLVRVLNDGYDTNGGSSTNAGVSALLATKQRKQLHQRAIALFTEQPKQALQFMIENGLLEDMRPHQVATACFTMPFNKKTLGDFLSKPANLDVLMAYMNAFRWPLQNRPRIDEALRMVMERFRLPGEAQQILRVVEAFSASYFEQCTKHELAEYWKQHPGTPLITETENAEGVIVKHVPELPPQNVDAVFVLAYGIIMLNTDQHNKQVRKRMVAADFIKNMRMTNGGMNFHSGYLTDIFESIRSQEILMPDEHEGEVGFEYLVREVCNQYANADGAEAVTLGSPAQQVALDRTMFQQSWHQMAVVIVYAFYSCETQHMLQRAIHAYHQLCSLAFYYGMVEELDALLVTLFRGTRYMLSPAYREAYVGGVLPAMEVVADDHDVPTEQRITNHLRKRLGFMKWLQQSVYSQVSCLVAFRNLSEYGDGASDTWLWAANVMCTLYTHELMDAQFWEHLDFSVRPPRYIPIPRIYALSEKSKQSQNNSKSSDTQPDGGQSFFYTLSSFLMSTGEPESVKAPPNPEDVETEQTCLKILQELKLDRLFLVKSKHLNDAAFTKLVTGLLQQVQTGEAGRRVAIQMQDKTLFVVELVTRMLEVSPHRITTSWQLVKTQLGDKILGAISMWNPMLVDALCTSIIRLCIATLPATDFQLISAILAWLMPKVLKSDTASTNSQFLASLQYLLELLSDSNNLLEVYAGENVEQLSRVIIANNSKAWDCLQCILKGLHIHPLSAKSSTCLVTPKTYSWVIQMLSAVVHAPEPVTTVHPGSISSNLQKGNPVKGDIAADVNGLTLQLEALRTIYSLSSRIYTEIVPEPGSDDSFQVLWMPILNQLSQGCISGVKELRQQSFAFLQRALMLSNLTSDGHTQNARLAIRNFLVPLCRKPLTDQQLVTATAPELPLRLIAILGKVFLHLMPVLQAESQEEFVGCWTGVLDVLRENHALNDFQLQEAVSELVKNMLLVMSTAETFGHMTPDSTGPPADNEVWMVTCEHLDKWLPQIKSDLYPGCFPQAAQTGMLQQAPTASGQVVVRM